MAINVLHEPNRAGTGMLQFWAAYGQADRQRQEQENAAKARSDQAMWDSVGQGVQQVAGAFMDKKAKAQDQTNRMDLQQLIGQQGMEREGLRQASATWRRQADKFQDEYGVTPSSLAGQVPQAGEGMLQQPQQQPDPMGGMAGPPASMAPGMQPIPLTPEAQQQQGGGAPFSQSQPPEGAGPQYYAQNPAVVPQMGKLKKRLDQFTSAASLVESNPNMPDEEKAAQLSMLAPHVSSLTREYNALTKRYPVWGDEKKRSEILEWAQENSKETYEEWSSQSLRLAYFSKTGVGQDGLRDDLRKWARSAAKMVVQHERN